MGLDQTQQFEKVISESGEILLLLPQNPSGDAIGAAWALYFFLKKKGKNAVIVFEGKDSLKKFEFLPRPEKILHELSGTQDFVLSFNTKFNKIIDIKTERLEEELRVYITPEKGSIDPRDFSFIPSRFKYDALVVLGSPDRESLGKVFEESPDIFYEVPVINIDHHSSNDRFGQLNILDIAASSTAEVLADIFSKMEGDIIDEAMAQCLLAGIIDATNSFQNKNTTPKALQMSAALMAKGADQQKIIRYLYKTQPLAILKLWGRIMARLRWDEGSGLVWAPVLLEDFVQSRSNPSDIPMILDKIMENYSNGKIFMVIYNESPANMKVIVRSSVPEAAKKIALIFDGKFSGDVCEFSLASGDMQQAGESVAKKLKELLA
ncbi:MAG: Phosphoesterase RecJ domain protein [Candidatus Moranbacteria bacterium GW2011_GWE1_49_15]|nr:MAG: Phosphoesterase RecJ domain protein [Candidatus Moranbacteria bacterium GW2011_GWE2_47_10]KKW05685.1 MAG: Phosphoesterase RecJ domain protein [Candidatus Moranbacteria bacterium GW2011_GWE1_49_15]HBP01164.1 hypothetical protein [Candidatus Moranbacteria bacterium]